MKGITSPRPLSTPKLEQTDLSGDDNAARRRAPVGDAFNNQEWSDHLSNQSNMRQLVQRSRSRRERTWISESMGKKRYTILELDFPTTNNKLTA